MPSDPAQVIVNHASFRVQLGASARHARSPRIARHLSAAEDTARIPVVTTVGAAGRAPARRRPVVWSGRSAPDDTGAHRLLQAVRHGGVRHADEPFADTGGTRVIPRPGHGDHDDGPDTQPLELPFAGARRQPLLPPMRTVGSAYDEPLHHGPGAPGYGRPAHGEDEFGDTGAHRIAGDRDTGRRGRRHGEDPARHAYYPGRRMNLGVVLLPLRVLLGSISVYAGMDKLCDPLYLGGGGRGSMVKWLHTLHPWDAAEPLRQFALEHPVGSGLALAFLQIVVGVLTVLGCWQRVAAAVGALLSAALLVAVSWKSVPVYETPDIVYLAAWSPLIIAGAPVYSVDGRLAGGAWRRLGPRADIWDLRRHVLRRGALVTAVVCGLTLLVGSLLGGAVRDADRVVVPGPGEAPRNELPGSPLPQEPGESPEKRTPSASTPPSRSAATPGSTGPSAGTTGPGATQGAGAVTPSQTRGGTGQAPPRQSSPAGQVPSTSSGPTSGGSATGGGSGAPSGGGGNGGGSDGRSGLVGGLLG
ncbi:DoxX family membrane protein [Streptomyces prasinosporus]|uniref:DoxX family membrane protein n=1 Tax=Streptomyces prasinosporus TaxID=68256 RepID=A0ABP6TH75_9ACTN